MRYPFRATLTLLCLASIFFPDLRAQIDPERRRLVQVGYNQPIEGRGPIAAYGFYYYNKPEFLRTNLTLRLTVAPIYVDSELGFSRLLGPNTDVAVGLAGGGFADSYSEVRQGRYLQEESFVGHGGHISASIYHRLNPAAVVPLTFIARPSVHRAMYESDSDTHPGFQIPDDRTSVRFRTGLRFGGQEPELNAPLALELSGWYELDVRTDSGPYGFNRDRFVEPQSHLFWGRGLLKYTMEPSYHWFELSLTAGTSVHADRFSAYRLGGFLPFTSEFPLNIPGYYFREVSAEQFGLLNGQYSLPLHADRFWRLNLHGAAGVVDYAKGLSQPGIWHSGIGGGISWTSPSETWLISVVYGHGFNAMRSHGRSSNNIGIFIQYDFDAKLGRSRFSPGVDPYKSRGAERFLFE